MKEYIQSTELYSVPVIQRPQHLLSAERGTIPAGPVLGSVVVIAASSWYVYAHSEVHEAGKGGWDP